jgi:hypothetical protein
MGHCLINEDRAKGQIARKNFPIRYSLLAIRLQCHLTQKQLRPRVLRVGEEIRRRVGFDDLAGFHEDDAVGDFP